MERVMSVEEKIRRAEEIYQRRKQGESRQVTKVAVNNKKDIRLLKKMIIQILICVTIYLIIYTVQNKQYVFSEDFVNKTNEILSYDTNFMELYEQVKKHIINFINNESNQEINENTEVIEEVEQELIIQEEQESLSQEEIDIQNVKNTTTFIKPVEGVVTSKYGQRDTATGNVPKNHTGTDISAETGTKIKSATSGEVVLVSEEGDYR